MRSFLKLFENVGGTFKTNLNLGTNFSIIRSYREMFRHLLLWL